MGLFLLDTVHRYFWCVTKKIKKYTLYLLTVSELNALNLRELFDLGLSRLMIRNVAYDAVYENGDSRNDFI